MNCWDKFLSGLVKKSEQKKIEDKTPWFSIAKAEIGVKSIPGKKHNPRILEYGKEVSYAMTTDDSSHPWCASFMCWCLHMAGMQSTRSAAARSFLNLKGAKAVKLSDAQDGDIVIFSRGSNGWSGHCAFYAGQTSSSIKCLGGNQSNAVNITDYSKSRLLGIRRPIL